MRDNSVQKSQISNGAKTFTIFPKEKKMSKSNIITKTILTYTILSLVSINTVQAVHGNYQEAMQIRRFLNATEPYLQHVPLDNIQNPAVAETILLPVSRGFNQRGTRLCWAYAALNALETIYLVRNPEGPDVELSRRAMQYYTMEDRYLRSIKGVNTFFSEAGVVLDAIRLIQANGIVSFDDYYDINEPYGQANIRYMIYSAESFTDKIIAMYEGMDIVYTAPPTKTHIPSSHALGNQNPLSVEAEAGDLARLVLANDVWQSYTPSSTKIGFHDHPDPDSRWENKSWYMPRSEFPDRIKRALKAGFPVIVSIQSHALLIYGADYDSNGSPIVYYIKDSYPDYYSLADADAIHESFWEMTTIKLSEPVAYWKLDETEGFIAHDSARNRDGTVHGGPEWRPAGGVVGGALQLDGIDDYVETEFVLSPAEGPFSVFAWIKGGAPGQAILSQIDGANWILSDASEGKLMTELKAAGRGAAELLSQTIITDGNWHRIGLVWDGSHRTLYVDDLAVAEDAQTNLEASENGLYIGAGKAMEPGSFWSGLIDDVRIYNRTVKP